MRFSPRAGNNKTAIPADLLRRHCGVIMCNIDRSCLGTVPGKLCVHAVQQVFQLECFLFEINADVLCSTSCVFSREYHSHALLYLL